MHDWGAPDNRENQSIRQIYSPEASDTAPTLTQRIARIGCWWRGYHVNGPMRQAKFRYDVPGYCFDCGQVGKE